VTADGRGGRSGADAATPGAPVILRDLADLLGGESPASRRFLGGLVMGALVGAAIAGSTLWRRRSRNGREGDGRR
jgi:hypothetical protein